MIKTYKPHQRPTLRVMEIEADTTPEEVIDFIEGYDPNDRDLDDLGWRAINDRVWKEYKTACERAGGILVDNETGVNLCLTAGDLLARPDNYGSAPVNIIHHKELTRNYFEEVK
jgi:hypothetical protein